MLCIQGFLSILFRKCGSGTSPPTDAHWKTIKRRRLARYQCENCGMDWNDSHRNRAVLLGLKYGDKGWHTEGDVRRPISVAFHLPSYYSPFVSLSDVMADYLQGLTDPAKNKIYVTQHKARLYKQTVTSSTNEKILAARCDLAPQLVPENAIAISAGVDVQKLGFWFVVRAWARDFTSWLIHYGFLASWEDVENLLFNTRYPLAHDPGRPVGIWRAGIDTGGGKNTKTCP